MSGIFYPPFAPGSFGPGPVTIGPPTAGVTLTLTAAGAGAAALAINASATTGVQTATFVAANKPGSGPTSPDLWIPITLAGVLHYIPAFL